MSINVEFLRSGKQFINHTLKRPTSNNGYKINYLCKSNGFKEAYKHFQNIKSK